MLLSDSDKINKNVVEFFFFKKKSLGTQMPERTTI